MGEGQRAGAEETKTKAPMSAAFATVMKEVFEDVKLIFVREGEVNIDKRDEAVYATCFMVKKKNERRPHKR